MNERRGMVLVLVLFFLALAGALTVPIAARSGSESLILERRSAALAHELAVQSVVDLLPSIMTGDRELAADLRRLGRSERSLIVGRVQVTLTLQDDSAKLPVNAPWLHEDPGRLPQALQYLAARASLPPFVLRSSCAQAVDSADPLAPSKQYICLDDLFEAPTDAGLFGGPEGDLGWAAFLTTEGATVNLRQAPPAVLGAALLDLDPQVAASVSSASFTEGDELGAALSAAGATGESLAAAARRLGDRAERYSLLVRTRLGPDIRRHYLVCTATEQPAILINWEVAP